MLRGFDEADSVGDDMTGICQECLCEWPCARCVVRQTRAIIRGIVVMLVLVAIVFPFTGCTTIATTPSPQEVISEGNFQMRLHETRGASLGGIDGGTSSVSGQSATEGVADGCILTVLGEAPESVTAELVAGECEASLHGD